MHVISRRKIREFVVHHPDAEASLTMWWTVTSKAAWQHIMDTRRSWNSADPVEGFTVFNISGNNYRLVAEIFYQDQVVLIRHILTHAEYERGQWRD